MGHFDDQEWIDLARGTIDPGRSAELEAHLAEGCSACQTTVSWWRGVIGLASRVRQSVPEDAVRNVKSAFSLVKTPGVVVRTIQFATMVFDSFLSPAPAGARSAWFGQRHCVYQSGGFTVEFHLGAGRENDKGFLTGQIADPFQRSLGFSGSQVKLVQGTSVTAETTANAYGEFMLEMTLHESQWILIEIPERPPIAIPIPNPRVHAAGGGQQF